MYAGTQGLAQTGRKFGSAQACKEITSDDMAH